MRVDGGPLVAWTEQGSANTVPPQREPERYAGACVL